MLPALLTTLLWSVSVVCATRSTRYLGSAVANLTRLCLATVLLAVWAHGFGKGRRRRTLVLCLERVRRLRAGRPCLVRGAAAPWLAAHSFARAMSRGSHRRVGRMALARDDAQYRAEHRRPRHPGRHRRGARTGKSCSSQPQRSLQRNDLRRARG